MLPNRLVFLSEFEKFYNNLVLNLKENKYNEQEFYLIMAAKIKSMDRARRERLTKLSQKIKIKVYN